MLAYMSLLAHLSPYLSSGTRSVTTKIQEVLMVLMRLRLNLPVRVLADWFQISSSGVSRIFLKTLDVMYARLLAAVYWPDRESLRSTMPYEFK